MKKKTLKEVMRKPLCHQHQKVTITPIARGSKKKYRVTEHCNQSNWNEETEQQWGNMNIICC